MKQKLAVFLFVFSILAYASFIGLAAYRIVQARSAGIESAKGDFRSLENLVRSSLVQGKDFRSKIFIEQMRTSYAANPRLLSLLVRDENLRVAYAIPASAALPATSPRASRLPAFLDQALRAAKEYPLSRFYASLDIPGSKPMGIEAVFSSLPTLQVQEALRDSLIGIVCILFVALILRLALAMGENEGEEEAALAATGGYRLEPLREPAPASSLSEEFEIPAFDIDAPSSRARPLPSSPQGLYSPRSGLGWESYLADRLDSELSRCASLGLDCSFIAIECPGLLPGDPAYGRAAAAVKDFFSFKDISFESGESGFAVILPGKDIEQALKAARDFLADLPGGSRIGLSSRSGRLVDSAVILQEARSALERASSSPDSPVIGFKADPERYRSYVSGKI